MKKLKWIIPLLIVVSLVTGVIGCKDPEVEHQHQFTKKWEIDEYYHWKKCNCGEIDFESEHSFGDWQVIKAATEEAEGKHERKCTVCPYTTTEVIEKLAHTHKFATDWTKDETNHWHVSTCGHEVTDGKATHTFGKWQVTKEASCIENGERKATCTVCDFEKTEVSEKAEHTFGDWTVTKAATEEAEGTKERSCTVCGYIATEVIEKLAHTHKFAESLTKDETHHWYAAICEHTTEVSEKAEHTFGEYVSNNDATTEADGTKTRECSVCGYEDTVTDEGSKIHVHTFAEEWTSDSSGHWYASTCGHTTEVSEKAKHTFGEWQVTKEASCTEKGEKKATCTICSYEKTEVTYKAEHTYTDGICECGMREMVLIPAGTFQMGSEKGYYKDKPVHQVTITKSFYMGKYEVTQAEYEKYCSYGSSSSSYGDGDNYPAYYVSWYDALVYCNKRSMEEGLTPCYSINETTNPNEWGTVPTSRNNSIWDAVICNWNANGYRLPTEAEWEYAARAGDDTVSSLTYAGTNSKSNLGVYVWYTTNSSSKTHEVGTKKANAFGLYDMSGNVWEWCWNWGTNSYDAETEGGSDPTGSSAGSYRVGRGGSWYDDYDFCAVSCRFSYYPDRRSNNLGFRVVRASSK